MSTSISKKFTESCKCLHEKKKPSETLAGRFRELAVNHSVPLGYVPIVVCSTIPIMTCAERFLSVPIDYGQLKLLTATYRVTLVIIIKRTITLSTANAIRKEYGNHTPIIL